MSALDTDFGRIIHGQPASIVRPGDASAIGAALEDARRHRLAVTVRGTGHSCHGQTVSDGGAMLATTAASSATPALLPGGIVDVPASARWRQVEAWLNARGQSMPVLADYLDLSVGGTLSVGGYGIDSVRHGAQVDQVERLRLITPDGLARWCSPRENRELFSYALAGLGQVGVIERVVLRTTPFQRATALFVHRHRSLEELIASLAWLSDASAEALPPLAKALAARGRFLTTWGGLAGSWRDAWRLADPAPRSGVPVRRFVTIKYRALRDLSVRAWLLRFPRHRRLWCDYLFDHDGLRSFARFLAPVLAGDGFRGCLRAIYIVPIRRLPRPVAFPLEAMGPGRQSMMFGIGLYSMIPPGRPDLVGPVAAAAARCLDACLSNGGRPYLYGWHDMDDAARLAVYGPAYERLRALRRELDPEGTFQPATFDGTIRRSSATSRG